MEPGQILLIGNSIHCTPTNDLVWEVTYRNHIRAQREIGMKFVYTLIRDLKDELGL